MIDNPRKKAAGYNNIPVGAAKTRAGFFIHEKGVVRVENVEEAGKTFLFAFHADGRFDVYMLDDGTPVLVSKRVEAKKLAQITGRQARSTRSRITTPLFPFHPEYPITIHPDVALDAPGAYSHWN